MKKIDIINKLFFILKNSKFFIKLFTLLNINIKKFVTFY